MYLIAYWSTFSFIFMLKFYYMYFPSRNIQCKNVVSIWRVVGSFKGSHCNFTNEVEPTLCFSFQTHDFCIVKFELFKFAIITSQSIANCRCNSC